jgi:DNA-binding NarL/FixJ family response regulator
MRGNGERTAVVLDEQPLWLEAMEKLLNGVGISVVGKTTDPDEALDLVGEHHPDVLLVGYGVNGEVGADCLRRAHQLQPELKTVVLSASSDPEQIESAFAAGASVFCVKTAVQDDLMAAIRQAFDVSIYLARTVQAVPQREPLQPGEAPGLTRREIEILQLVAEGHSNSQLARMLWVTEQTVKFHLSNIYRKLDVANRTEASRWAQLHGLLPEPIAETAA